MTMSTNGQLIYRATRDGFTREAFHDKCDNKANTISIIKNNLNYVFGGYTSSVWNTSDTYVSDANAFIFSLRRNGESKNEKFSIKIPEYAIFRYAKHCIRFGGGADIFICNNSNTAIGSYTNFGHSYELPKVIPNVNEKTIIYLTGNINGWLTTEIEVYQIGF